MTVHCAFSHRHNCRAVAAQEYELAKQHLREVCQYRDATNPDHQRRFHDALQRQEMARQRWLEALCE